MLCIFARPTDWIAIPVSICWSEKDRRSLRGILDGYGDEVDSRRTMSELRMKAVPAVMMNERRTPAPATPASVEAVGGIMVQFGYEDDILKVVLLSTYEVGV